MGLTLPSDPHEFKDSRKGETAYVIASGSSVDHVPRWFFADKLCVAVNFVGVRLKLPEFYTVTHYWTDANQIAAARPDLPVIAPMVDQGGPAAISTPPAAPNVYRFKTNAQAYSQFDCAELWPKEPHALIAGPTSLNMTMHFAAYLGARHIILVGADCGLLDGRANFDGYARGDNPMPVWAEHLPKVANQLRAESISVMSLNPFVNFALEGHRYDGPCTIN